MPTAAGERLLPLGLVVLTAILGAHAIPLRNRRLSDSNERARCPDDLSGLIPVGCPVELTRDQEALQFVCPYTLLEVCTWSVKSRAIGSTDDYYQYHVFASGHVAVVSNFVPGQGDLALLNVMASSLEGTEVTCSCQLQGEEQGSPTITKTVIVDKRDM